MTMQHGINCDLFVDTGAFVPSPSAAVSSSALLAYHRNRMVSKLNLGRYTHVFWLDDHLWFGADILVKLLSSTGISFPLVVSQDGARVGPADRLESEDNGHGAIDVAHAALIPASLYAAGATHMQSHQRNEFASVVQHALSVGMRVELYPDVRVTHVDLARYGLVFPSRHLDNATFQGPVTEMSVFVPASIDHKHTLTRTLWNLYQLGGSPGRINHNAFLYFRRHTYAEARALDRTETVNPSASWGQVVHRMWVKMALIRNSMVAHSVLAGVDFVWWLDFDIVSFPLDFSTRAVRLGNRTITCPSVLIEGTMQFYDTCGFVALGRSRVTEAVRRSWNGCDCTMFSRDGPPTCLASNGSGEPVIRPGDGIHVNNLPVAGSPSYVDAPGDLVHMDGCGATYIMPAAILRDGAEFKYDAMFTDHYPVMRWARGHGYRVLWHRPSIAFHADVDGFGPMQTNEKRTASNT